MLGKPTKHKSTAKKIVKRWDLLVNQDRKFIFINKIILGLMLVMLIIFRAKMDQSDIATVFELLVYCDFMWAFLMSGNSCEAPVYFSQHAV